ncbi:LOW QUALITY PROTEIN: uncharacterized protein LOC124275770 [Haliotis rubra]|uniref:LOW QUALITY PROTEIN: uncharacterized protein LOC124275770 n=1 Tax=Haliotis rubra TaxID=36100 RepID=UPI001EE5D4A0|nr:LOW QUALITY PROTEIN: uncharacterized protein LOC124275770 [Haliotis rubra]
MSEDTAEGEGQLFGESSVDSMPATESVGGSYEEGKQIQGSVSENRKETTVGEDFQTDSVQGDDVEFLSQRETSEGVSDDVGRDETVDGVQCDSSDVRSTITKDDANHDQLDDDLSQSVTSKGAEALPVGTESGECMEGSAVDPPPPEADKDEAATSDAHTQKEGKKKKKDKQAVIDNDEEVNVGDLSQLTEDSRNILFGRALVYERDSKKNCALKCYLACLSHLTPESNFVLLPQCLRNIADLYYRKEEYEKAILFIQAEKLFYENALVDTNEIQQKIESLRQGAGTSDSSRSNEDAKIAADSLRADEYEHLAKLCVDKGQPQLALEYAGKATKLRQKIYGNDNPITKESLDFFATLYAEVGKQQYSDSITQLNDGDGSDGASVSPAVTPSMERSPSSILRQRRAGDDKEKKQVRFQEPEGGSSSPGSDSTREQEEFISHTLLWVLFAICFLLLCILGLWLLCSMSDSLACQWVKGELHYFYMRVKYYYYQYASTKKVKYA